ncbi:hypothetical protein [Acrocarpospora sp. B8E8]|uniref:hypothetical protein n=1 Tax=Acrocarpospora sp. B8E8 TaxID=3153572 RepID=UPI00325CA0D0
MRETEKQVIRLTVVETVEYKIELDVEDLDIPEEILGDIDAVEEWLGENEREWIDECSDNNFSGCLERDITDSSVKTVKQRWVA